MSYELKFEISVYDKDNDYLIERYTVDTEEEKNEILKKHYHEDTEATHCDVKKIQTETSNYSKRVYDIGLT